MTDSQSFHLQHYAHIYLQDLGPTLSHGWYYMQYIIRRYVENGCTGSPAELLQDAAQRYGRHPNTIKGCIQNYTLSAFRKNDTQCISLWREIGWDETVPMVPSKIIPLLCRGFFPYMKRHHPSGFEWLVIVMLTQ